MTAMTTTEPMCAHFSGRLDCLKVGHLILRRAGDRLWVLQAEPRILITGQLLWELEHGNGHPDVTLSPPPSPHTQHAGSVLTVRAENQTVIYRIGEQAAEHFQADLWPAEWPD